MSPKIQQQLIAIVLSYVGCQQIYEVESPVLSVLKLLLGIAEANSHDKIITVTTVCYLVPGQ